MGGGVGKGDSGVDGVTGGGGATGGGGGATGGGWLGEAKYACGVQVPHSSQTSIIRMYRRFPSSEHMSQLT